MPLVLVHGTTRVPLVRDVSVGSGESCELSIAGLNDVHARIHATGDRLVITPAENADVRVGGVRVEDERWLHFGDTICMADVELSIDLDDTELPLRTAELALAIVRRLKTTRAAIVHVVEGPDLGAELALVDEAKPLRIGRATSCALILGDPTVSREHVRITRNGERALVADMDAPRGSFLGDTRLAPERDAEWSPALALRIGKTVLRLQLPDAPERIAQLAERLGPHEPPAQPPTPEPPPRQAPTPARAEPVAAPIVEIPVATPPTPPRIRTPQWIFASAIALIAIGSAALLYWILR